MLGSEVGREVREQRTVPPVLQYIADQRVRRGQPRRRRPSTRRWRWADIISAVRGLRARGVEFMPTPGSYYDTLPARMERTPASARSTSASTSSASCGSWSTARARPVPAADLSAGLGGPAPRSGGGAVLLRDHPAQGGRGVRRRQLPRAVRVDRERPGRPAPGNEAAMRLLAAALLSWPLVARSGNPKARRQRRCPAARDVRARRERERLAGRATLRQDEGRLYVAVALAQAEGRRAVTRHRHVPRRARRPRHGAARGLVSWRDGRSVWERFLQEGFVVAVADYRGGDWDTGERALGPAGRRRRSTTDSP